MTTTICCVSLWIMLTLCSSILINVLHLLITCSKFTVYAMNIFVLDYSPIIAARYHCNKHVVKMIVETTQILSTVNRLFGIQEGYRSTHVHSACVIHTKSNLVTYMWVRTLGLELCKEYTRRYDRVHTTQAVLESLSIPPFDGNGVLNLAKCMPKVMPLEYHRPDIVESYRSCYRWKSTVMSVVWPANETPEWF